MKGVQKRQPKFLSKEPLGQDLFGEKSQETLANIIVKQIKGADPNHKMIGIEGCWGSGKSNLLKLVPIYPVYHTTLLPDSKLNTENEVDFLGKEPHRYALQKVYISFSRERNINPGDILLFYRNGEEGSNKKYTSVLTTIGIVDSIKYGFQCKEDFFESCQNRSVFPKKDLESFWKNNKDTLLVIKFIFVKSLTKRLTLEYLWNQAIVELYKGPRPFTRISDKQFNQILCDSQTKISFVGEQ